MKHSCDQGEKKRESRHKLDPGNVRAHSVHKKCDARQPCTTCANKNRGAACKYEGSRSRDNPPLKPPTPQRKDALAGPDSSESDSSRSPSVDANEKPLVPPYQSEREIPPLIPGRANPAPSLDGSLKGLGIAEWSLCSTESSFTTLPSIHFRAIPRPLGIPLSLIPPERVQVSRFPGSDQDMSLCVFSLRLRKFSSGRRG